MKGNNTRYSISALADVNRREKDKTQLSSRDEEEENDGNDGNDYDDDNDDDNDDDDDDPLPFRSFCLAGSGRRPGTREHASRRVGSPESELCSLSTPSPEPVERVNHGKRTAKENVRSPR